MGSLCPDPCIGALPVPPQTPRKPARTPAHVSKSLSRSSGHYPQTRVVTMVRMQEVSMVTEITDEAADLEIRLLRGALELWHRGELVDTPTERQLVAACIALALRADQVVTQQYLMHATGAFQAKRISEILSVLRTRFHLPLTKRIYRLLIPPDAVDILHFDRQACDLLSAARASARVQPDDVRAVLDAWATDPMSALPTRPS